jgi:hypothetical protein
MDTYHITCTMSHRPNAHVIYTVQHHNEIPLFCTKCTFNENSAMATSTLLMVPELVRAFMMVIRWYSTGSIKCTYAWTW